MLKISIVTPCLNQVALLEDTINSVLSQDYPNLEYIIIDGGSTDGSIDIIKKYANRLTYWISEPDKGKWDALNKGFKRSTGEIMAWLACGNKYFPWTFEVVSQIFSDLSSDLSNVEWLASSARLILNNNGTMCHRGNFLNLKRINNDIPYETVFWRRSLWKRINAPISASWAHFRKYAILHTTTVPLAAVKYSGKISLMTVSPAKFWQSIFKKFISSLPYICYIAGYTKGKIGYDTKINRWCSPRPFSGNIGRFIRKVASKITKLIFSQKYG